MKFEKYPTRAKALNYMTPRELFQLDLCAEEIAIYSYLLNLENKDFQCWPSYKTIGKSLNIKSKNSVKKYVDGLCEKMLIETEYTDVIRNGKLWNGNLKYTIRPIYEAIQYRLQQQFKENDERIKRERLEKILKKREAEAKKDRAYGQVS